MSNTKVSRPRVCLESYKEEKKERTRREREGEDMDKMRNETNRKK
jgi:hypothetical protein